jgi:hypothetical protein
MLLPTDEGMPTTGQSNKTQSIIESSQTKLWAFKLSLVTMHVSVNCTYSTVQKGMATLYYAGLI